MFGQAFAVKFPPYFCAVFYGVLCQFIVKVLEIDSLCKLSITFHKSTTPVELSLARPVYLKL